MSRYDYLDPGQSLDYCAGLEPDDEARVYKIRIVLPSGPETFSYPSEVLQRLAKVHAETQGYEIALIWSEAA